MTTKFRLISWTATGFRCPDHQVRLGPDDKPSPLALVQMPNGTGKTTTLNLLRATLSGDASSWTAEQVADYRKKDGSEPTGTFTLRARLDATTFTIKLTLNFETGTAQYHTTLRSGQVEGFHPPQALAQYLKPSFVKFFVFDGELAAGLLNAEDGSAEAVVEELFHLKYFRHLRDRIGDYWTRQVAGRSAQEEKGFSRRTNRVRTLQERLESLRVQRERLTGELADAQKQLQSKKAAFDKAIKEQQQDTGKLMEADRALAAAEEKVRAQARAVLHTLRDPHALAQAFGDEMSALKLSFDRVKLPETAAREFFEELAQESECVCGRPLDETTRTALRARARSYLGSEEVNVLNAIKTDITAHVSGPESAFEAAGKSVSALVEANKQESIARTRRDAVRDEATDNRPDLRDAKEEIEALAQKVTKLETELAKYSDSNAAKSDDSTSVAIIEELLERAEKELAEITHTLDLRSKRDALQTILDKAHLVARERMCDQIRDEANSRILALMPQNRIRIATLGRAIELDGQAGASVGETLSVAYAFLSTLFNCSEHVLPFVVDSPANPIDLAGRKRVAALVPQLSEQFIAFTISSERPGFLEPLEKAGKGKIAYATVFRKGTDTLESAAKKHKSRDETNDGVVVYGREFFLSVHVDEEPRP